MTQGPATARLRPLLRVNDWQVLEVTQQLRVQQRAIDELDARIAGSENELRACYERAGSAVGGREAVNAGAYEQACAQAAAWLRGLRRLQAQRREEAARLAELQAQLAELKHKRSVIERRRDELGREHEGIVGGRLAAEQDDLWLSRRST